MSEELGVRSEELIGLLRGCAEGETEICAQCKLNDVFDCSGALMYRAADEIERLSRSRIVDEYNRQADELKGAYETIERMKAEGMSANEYQRLAMRTKSSYHAENDQLINAALGLSGESGEFADLLKKYLYQGHTMDDERMVKELGDVLWYAALAADALGVTLGEIMQKNIDKLRKRYPEGFDAERSVNRAES